jgi:uncharacterized membrane protein YdbT with pleckstrin-like domain
MRIPAPARFLRVREYLEGGRGGVPEVVSNYLLPHEEMVITVRRHPGIFIAHISVLACCCLAAILLTVLTGSAFGFGVAWGVCLALLIWLAVRAVAWLEEYFVATESRLIFVTGRWRRKTVSVPLREIADIKSRRSLIGRLAGYGEFIAEPVRPGRAIPKMNYMPYLDQLLAEIQHLFHPDLGDDA